MSETLKFGNGQWAVKNGSALAYNDENDNFKPLPFTFVRDTGATRVNKQGLIEVVPNNEPRIDFLNDSNGALLLEPSRSNLFTYSEDFSASIWGLNGSATREANATISPDGTLNAYKITSNGGSIGYGQGGVVSENSTYEISFFAKKGTDNIIQITESFYFGSSTIFDLESGSITSGNGTIESYSNDWYRCSVSYTYGSGQTILSFNIKNTGSGYFYLFGFQGEQGSYSTSYIPTQGSIGTRVAESCYNQPPSGIIGQTELTLFYQGIVERLGGSDGHAIALSQSADAAGSSRILLYRNSYGDMYVYVQDTTTVFSTPLLVNSNPQINDKYAIAIKDNDLVIYCNGVKVAENNSGTIPTMQYIYLNEWSNQINQKNITQEVKLYNTRLSNTELATLTS